VLDRTSRMLPQDRPDVAPFRDRFDGWQAALEFRIKKRKPWEF